jgi:hypothetical protein
MQTRLGNRILERLDLRDLLAKDCRSKRRQSGFPPALRKKVFYSAAVTGPYPVPAERAAAAFIELKTRPAGKGGGMPIFRRFEMVIDRLGRRNNLCGIIGKACGRLKRDKAKIIGGAV